MIYEKILQGHYVDLRAVKEEDAESILSIRNTPEISKYLPALHVTVEQQKEWIRKQRTDNNSYYFLIEDKKGKPIGTMSIYDMINRHAEGGRSCSIGDTVQNMEAIVLFHDFVFCELRLEYITCWVFEENKSVLSLNKKIGYDWIKTCDSKDEGMSYKVGVLSCSQYLNKAPNIREKIRLLANSEKIK